ncbi:hypothetical protein DFP73DRAFT_634642 [Morchella snyderi]|nr:hypothetical protein DFP73DRAFT_634642 [Morchella snyderi]
MDKYFEQPHNVKVKDYRESEERGYKPGEFESTLGGHSVLPAILMNDSQVIRQFTTVSHHLSKTMQSTPSGDARYPFRREPPRRLTQHHMPEAHRWRHADNPVRQAMGHRVPVPKERTSGEFAAEAVPREVAFMLA